MSDVPLGLFLSGGLDSSGLAALMAPMARGPHPDLRGRLRRRGEQRAAVRAAGGPGGRRAAPRGRRLAERLLRRAAAADLARGRADRVPVERPALLRVAARPPHVKVVLTGEGADELFLGYTWYRLTALERAPRRSLPAARPRRPPPGDPARDLRGCRARLRRYASRTFLALEPGVRAMFYENFAVFPEGAPAGALLRDRRLCRGASTRTGSSFGASTEAPGSTLDRMSHADLQTYLVELLMKQDQMSMAASIESRVPFLDHELVEHVVRMPARFKVRGLTTKAVLREALRKTRAAGDPPSDASWASPCRSGAGRGSGFAASVRSTVLGPRALARELFDPAVARAPRRRARERGRQPRRSSLAPPESRASGSVSSSMARSRVRCPRVG